MENNLEIKRDLSSVQKANESIQKNVLALYKICHLLIGTQFIWSMLVGCWGLI